MHHAKRRDASDDAESFTEMCSGSEAGSYSRLIDCVYHLTLGLRVIKKQKKSKDVEGWSGLVLDLERCREGLEVRARVVRVGPALLHHHVYTSLSCIITVEGLRLFGPSFPED